MTYLGNSEIHQSPCSPAPTAEVNATMLPFKWIRSADGWRFYLELDSFNHDIMSLFLTLKKTLLHTRCHVTGYFSAFYKITVYFHRKGASGHLVWGCKRYNPDWNRIVETPQRHKQKAGPGIELLLPVSGMCQCLNPKIQNYYLKSWRMITISYYIMSMRTSNWWL